MGKRNYNLSIENRDIVSERKMLTEIGDTDIIPMIKNNMKCGIKGGKLKEILNPTVTYTADDISITKEILHTTNSELGAPIVLSEAEYNTLLVDGTVTSSDNTFYSRYKTVANISHPQISAMSNIYFELSHYGNTPPEGWEDFQEELDGLIPTQPMWKAEMEYSGMSLSLLLCVATLSGVTTWVVLAGMDNEGVYSYSPIIMVYDSTGAYVSYYNPINDKYMRTMISIIGIEETPSDVQTVSSDYYQELQSDKIDKDYFVVEADEKAIGLYIGNYTIYRQVFTLASDVTLTVGWVTLPISNGTFIDTIENLLSVKVLVPAYKSYHNFQVADIDTSAIRIYSNEDSTNTHVLPSGSEVIVEYLA